MKKIIVQENGKMVYLIYEQNFLRFMGGTCKAKDMKEHNKVAMVSTTKNEFSPLLKRNGRVLPRPTFLNLGTDDHCL